MSTRIRKYNREPDVTLDGTSLWLDPRINYSFNYAELFEEVSLGHLPKKEVLRKLILEDPFFVTYFILGWPGSNSPFVVSLCQELKEAPNDYRLLLAARGHGKTTIDTIAGTLRDICRNPNDSTGLFSFTRDAARSMLGVIKRISETSSILKFAFPEIFYENPERESPCWNSDMLLFKRSTNEMEMTVEAWGLERLPTGKHFNILKFDDIITADLVKNPEVMIKTSGYFDMALECVSEKHRHTVTGTYYDHRDVLNVLRERGTYHIIRRPATHDGTKEGVPVFLSKSAWEKKLKGSIRVLNTQQLLNATPESDRILEKANIRIVSHKRIPDRLYKTILVDPAGTKGQDKMDYWAVLCLGFDPHLSTEGYWESYLLDAVIKKMGHAEAMSVIMKMFLRNKPIQKIGVEKVGISSYEIHVSNLLKAKGYKFTLKNKRVTILTPKSRNKNLRIEESLAFPLNNHKISFSDKVPEAAVQKLFDEMDDFPYGHADGLDAFAYGLELISDVTMRKAEEEMRVEDGWSLNFPKAPEPKATASWRYV